MNCFCGRAAQLVRSTAVYRNDYGWIWLCSGFPDLCDGMVGCHRNTDVPLGTLCCRDVRNLRKLCHQAFDTLWKRTSRNPHPVMSRRGAYSWLACMMGVPEIHIGWMGRERCEVVLSLMADVRMSGAI